VLSSDAIRVTALKQATSSMESANALVERRPPEVGVDGVAAPFALRPLPEAVVGASVAILLARGRMTRPGLLAVSAGPEVEGKLK